MVIAVVGVRMVEPTVDQVVRVTGVRDGVVAAVRSVDVLSTVPVGGLRVALRVLGVHGEDVLVDVILVRVVQVPVVEVVDVPVMTDRGVAAVKPVDVVVGGVDLVIGAHARRR